MNRRYFITELSKGLAAAGLLGADAMPAPRISSTGFACDQNNIMLRHPHFTERPERLEWIRRPIAKTRLSAELKPIGPIKDPFKYINLIHSPEHIAEIKAIPETGPAAELAAALSLGAVRDVCEGRLTNAFSAIRPPGHHAHNIGAEEGFCFYCNAAIAAKYALTAHGIKRVLIIDWDYHHGNGTQYLFYADPSVLFFSTHDCHAYPGRFCDSFTWENTTFKIGSDPSCRGIGPGEGFTINVHMPCHSSNNDFIKVWQENLLGAADAFKPELVIISAGFDSKKGDMLGCFDLTAQGFSRLTRMAMDIAQKHCNGRLVSILEGGYADRSPANEFNGLACCVESHVRTLMTGEVQRQEAGFYLENPNKKGKPDHQ